MCITTVGILNQFIKFVDTTVEDQNTKANGDLFTVNALKHVAKFIV